MFTTFTKTICSLIITFTIATSAQAQLSSAFGGGGNSTDGGGSSRGQVQRPVQNNSVDVLGVWYTSGDTDKGHMEIAYAFQNDGTMALGVQRTPKGGQPQKQVFEGRYQMNGNQMTINYNDGDVENFQVSKQGDTLSLNSNQGGNYTLSRVQPNQSSTPNQNSGGGQVVQQNNPHAGHWVLSAQGNGTTMQGSLDLNADGTYQMNMSVKNQSGNNQANLSGRWSVEGNMIVFETDGLVERYPIQFDGQRLAIDLADWGVRTVFARNAQQSYVEPLAQNQPQADSGQSYTYQNGQPYSGDMANRF